MTTNTGPQNLRIVMPPVGEVRFTIRCGIVPEVAAQRPDGFVMTGNHQMIQGSDKPMINPGSGSLLVGKGRERYEQQYQQW
ncbi:hypothetical protein HBJ58_07630 [Halomonas desiderata]|uniref:hypothetical protein n=1 Tax=Billgrantia desiderata TaxID=52021 RepID=UPI000A3C9435|nr:hypothetical protein [Halomonas desiderata]MCE8011542.1 hypothetical protein [Halomonas desiderata]NIC36543.1 hypothetical protein [Halomonas desiderata]OUE39218.1 hypothetical protein BZY95_16930 [Halomonas desiderata SP1]